MSRPEDIAPIPTTQHTVELEDGSVLNFNLDSSLHPDLVPKVLEGAVRATTRQKAKGLLAPQPWISHLPSTPDARSQFTNTQTGNVPSVPVETPPSVADYALRLAQGAKAAASTVKEATIGNPEQVIAHPGEVEQLNTPFGSVAYQRGLPDALAAIPFFGEAYGGLRGFTSRVLNWLDKVPQETFSAEQLLGALKVAPVKQEELKWLGLNDWLKSKADAGKQVTKAEVQDFVHSHQLSMHEVQLGGNYSKEDLNLLERGKDAIHSWQQANPGRNWLDAAPEDLGMHPSELARYHEMDNAVHEGAQYNEPDYKTPGGKNYREVLIKFPNSPQTRVNSAGETYQHFVGPDLRYSSDHFGYQGQDLLAHVRVQDFKDDTGAKTLLVDEAQSDWHREGRQHGYLPQGGITELDPERYKLVQKPSTSPTNEPLYFIEDTKPNDVARRNHANDPNPAVYIGSAYTPEGARDAALSFLNYHDSTVPDAPFKNSWPDLMMKTQLRDAVEKGYDKLAWTTGKTQQDRWNLTRFFPNLTWEAGFKEMDRVKVIPTSEIDPNRYHGIAQQPGFVAVRSDDGYIPGWGGEVFPTREAAERDAAENLNRLGVVGNHVKIDLGRHAGDTQMVEMNRLEDYVGQQAADHIRAQIQAGVTTGNLQNVKSGGEWATNLYDKQIPDFMSKYVKQWGGKVEKSTLPTPRQFSIEMLPNGDYGVIEHGNYGHADRPGRQLVDHFPTRRRAQEFIDSQKTSPGSTEVWSVRITPEMRASIQAHGQPLWSMIPFAGPIIAQHVNGGQQDVASSAPGSPSTAQQFRRVTR